MSNTITTITPYTEKSIQQYTLLSQKAAEQAVDNADSCFQSWKLTSIHERAELAFKLAKILEDNQEELAQLMTDEMGKVLAQ